MPPVIIAAAVVGAAAVGAAAISSSGAESAAETMAESTMYASQQEAEAAAKAEAGLAPWREAGERGLATYEQMLKAGPGEYERSDYYNYLLESGTAAIEKSAAAAGKQLSGGELQTLTQYGQQLGSADYQTWLNNWYKSLEPWQNLSAQGLGAAGTTAQTQLQSGQTQANLTQQGGAIRGAAILGEANTQANALSSVSNSLQNYLTLNALLKTPSTTPTFQFGTGLPAVENRAVFTGLPTY